MPSGRLSMPTHSPRISGRNSDMDEATIALLAMSLGILAVFLGLLVWGIRSGQFRNSEETKYQIFRGPKTPDERNQG